MAHNNVPNIIEAIYDDRLFGTLFPTIASWASWIVFLKATFGVKMAQRELELYREYTGRKTQPAGGVKEAYAIVGRRGGKSRIIAIAICYIAAFHSFRQYLSAGERGVALILARDRDQARVCFGYIKGVLRSVPMLSKKVLAWRSDEIELRNGVTIMVKTADYRAIRGVTLVACVCDEVCFWDSQGVNPDKEIFSALRPSMVTIPQAKLLVISSPYAKYGQVFEAYRDHYGRDGDVLVWQAPTRAMNPTITDAFIQGEIERDPESARSEWLAQFREDIEAAFSLESIEACTIPGRTELAPAPGIKYVAFVDPSGGRRDSFTVAIAHRSGDVAVIDLVKPWRPPFDPSVVIKDCADVLKAYGVQSATGDAYGGEFAPAGFRSLGITYNQSDKNKSELYLALIPVLCSAKVELVDNRKLINEFRHLERRRGRSGRDTVDHPAPLSDDLANAVAGVVNLVLAGARIDTKQIFLVGERATWAGPDGYGPPRGRPDW